MIIFILFTLSVVYSDLSQYSFEERNDPQIEFCPITAVNISDIILTPSSPTFVNQSVTVNTTILVKNLYPAIISGEVEIDGNAYFSSSEIKQPNTTKGSYNIYSLEFSKIPILLGTYVYTVNIVDLNTQAILACFNYSLIIHKPRGNAGSLCRAYFNGFYIYDVHVYPYSQSCQNEAISIYGMVAANGGNATLINVSEYFNHGISSAAIYQYHFSEVNTSITSFNNYSIIVPPPKNCKAGSYLYYVNIIDPIANGSFAC